MSELPQGWVNTSLPNIAEIILGQSPPSITYNTEGKGLPFFQGKAEFGSLYPTIKKYCDEPGTGLHKKQSHGILGIAAVADDLREIVRLIEN